VYEESPSMIFVHTMLTPCWHTTAVFVSAEDTNRSAAGPSTARAISRHCASVIGLAVDSAAVARLYTGCSSALTRWKSSCQHWSGGEGGGGEGGGLGGGGLGGGDGGGGDGGGDGGGGLGGGDGGGGDGSEHARTRSEPSRSSALTLNSSMTECKLPFPVSWPPNAVSSWSDRCW
jgi:hypothetical protein